MSKLLKADRLQTIDGGMARIPSLDSACDYGPVGSEPDNGAIVALTERRASKLEQEARQMLEQARAEAKAILEDAHTGAQQVFDAARERGFEEGFATGEAKAKESMRDECRTQVERAQAVVKAARDERTTLLLDTKDVLSAVCMESVKELVRRDLLLAPADVEAMIDETLKYVVDGQKVEIHVNPSEFQLAMQAHPKWQTQKFGAWEVAIIPDKSVSAGGIEILSDIGRVDATLDTKFELLQDLVRKAITEEVTQRAASMGE